MKENEVKIGQTVYFQEHWSGVIQEAKVTEIKIEYSTVVENGQLIVKYLKLKPTWEHKAFGILNGIKTEVILRLPEAEKDSL